MATLTLNVAALFRDELVAYAKALEAGTAVVSNEKCHRCHSTYTGGTGWYRDCPRCTEQHEPLALLLEDGTRWPGHEFTWNICRGPRGRWELVGERVLVPIAELRDLAERTGCRAGDGKLFDAVVAEVVRLRKVVSEAALIANRAQERPEVSERRYAAERKLCALVSVGVGTDPLVVVEMAAEALRIACQQRDAFERTIEAGRTGELADRIGELEQLLKEKRAECDELRDQRRRG